MDRSTKDQGKKNMHSIKKRILGDGRRGKRKNGDNRHQPTHMLVPKKNTGPEF